MNASNAPLEAVIFDMDGTSLDTPHAQYSWLKQTAQRYGGLDPFPAFGAGFLEMYNDWLTRKKMPGLYEMIGVDYTGNRDAIHRDYDLFNQTHPIELIPGMPECIKQFKDFGFKLGVNTTKNMKSISAPLARYGLTDLFDAYVTADDILAQAERTGLPHTEFAKPHGYSAELILRKLDVAQENAAAIEDDTIGVTTYRNGSAQPRVIGVTWGFEPDGKRLLDAGADIVAHTTGELITAIMLRAHRR
ncbi:TPA: HAD family hydrolase [Candidatus Woesearchaeota archaeon]|nr:HAD family hydrolase [Candidatus Woesearchaeota archaeon]